MWRSSEDNHAACRLTWRQCLTLALVFVGALAIRGVYLWGQAANNPIFDDPFMDCRVHDEWARQIASGEGMGESPYFRAPLYYYLIGWLYKLTGPSVLAAKIAGVVLGAATCYLIALLGVMLGGFRVGLIAGLIAAVYWPFIYFDSHLLSVGLETFLNVGFLILLLAAARRENLWLFLAGGAVWGLSAIARPNVIALTPGIVAWMWFAIRRPPRFKRWVVISLVTGAGAAAAVLPVTLRNYVVGDELALVATNGGVNFYIGNNAESKGFVAVVPGTRPGWWEGYEDTHRIAEQALGHKPTESEVSQYWFDRGFEWIRSDPGAWLRLTLLKLRLFWTPMELPNNTPIWFFARMSPISVLFWMGFPVIAVLGLAGFTIIRGDWRDWALPATFGLLYMATVVAFFCTARYRIPAVPVLILASAAGVVALPRAFKEKRYGKLAAYAAVALIVAVVTPFNLPKEHAEFAAYSEAEGHRILGGHHARLSTDSPEHLDKTIEHYRLAAEHQPDDMQTALLLVHAMTASPGRTAEVIEVLEETVRRQPANLPALHELARTLGRERRFDEAVPYYQRAMRFGTPTPQLRYEYSQALRFAERYATAIEVLRQGLTVNQRDIRFMTSLAWLLATAPDDSLRDGDQALRLGRRAVSLSKNPPAPVLDALAAACAEVGRFDDARRYATQAIARARRSGRAEQASEIEARLRLYRQDRPYRDQPRRGDSP